MYRELTSDVEPRLEKYTDEAIAVLFKNPDNVHRIIESIFTPEEYDNVDIIKLENAFKKHNSIKPGATKLFISSAVLNIDRNKIEAENHIRTRMFFNVIQETRDRIRYFYKDFVSMKAGALIVGDLNISSRARTVILRFAHQFDESSSWWSLLEPIVDQMTYRKLMGTRSCGKVTADEICVALDKFGYKIPGYNSSPTTRMEFCGNVHAYANIIKHFDQRVQKCEILSADELREMAHRLDNFKEMIFRYVDEISNTSKGDDSNDQK